MAEIDKSRIVDGEVRAEALDPVRSFIVQAPAGSGKTELLTQRFLRLLACVDNPEEILAVTFTRKAAAEMRNRIISAIYPDTTDKRLPETVQLAEQVLERDRELNWHLAEYPARLRIRTLDSVNSWLSATAPLAGRGNALTVSETPDDLYRLAARRVVEQAADKDGAAVRSLLLHLDNRSDALLGLLAGMLGRRDQWLAVAGEVRHTDEISATVRAQLETVLNELVTKEISVAHAQLKAAGQSIYDLMQFATSNLLDKEPDSPWSAVAELVDFPEPAADALPAWRMVAEFLLTKSDQLRKTVTVANGFPPGEGPQKSHKDNMKALLTDLREIRGLEAALAVVRGLPEPAYTNEQWDVLRALLEVLQLAAAELMLVFAEQGEADYPAVAQSAINALVDDEGNPTDLALRLDFRLSHILIDEFQDTSSAQMDLLTSLTAGWHDGDGRSLFVVGDPMQSIYRFRKAEVGLFLQLQKNSLPNVLLNSITLQTNFRSDAVVVEWVNEVFKQVMPASDDITSGAVSYAPGRAARVQAADNDAFVQEHALLKPPRVDESEAIVRLIETTLEKWPDDDIGILVRSRKHAALIVSELRSRGIAFSGTGLENSIEAPVVQDLLCITRALSHRADRTAWLGLLRAPWSGLNLIDLEQLAGSDRKTCIWDLLADAEVFARLSAEGQARAGRVINVLEPVFSRRGSLPLRDLVEGVWVELGGPAFLSDEVDVERAGAFFDLLDQFDGGGDCADAFDLHQQIEKQLKVEDQKAKVNLLTIHKAKGLEFDTVILPALDAGTRGDDKPMLAWQEVLRSNAEPGLIIAPMERTGDDKDQIFELARRLNKEQDSYEKDRLLYVAATRARLRMHLFFGVSVDEEDNVKVPAANSLLARLWPAIGGNHAQLASEPGTDANPDAWLNPLLRRYTDGWQVPDAPLTFKPKIPSEVDETLRDVTYDWASPAAKHIGTVVHRWLEKIVTEGYESYDAERVAGLRPVFRQMLLADGIDSVKLDKAVDDVAGALLNTLGSDEGQWILMDTHEQSACELPVTAMLKNRMSAFVLDRTFIADDGIRWIIDYKSGTHEGGDLEGFFKQETERYTKQLRGYRDAMQLLEPQRQIKTALYFPQLQKLLPVEFD